VYRERLTENRSRELISDFLDNFLLQRGWWAARAAWVGERGMIIDPWRVAAAAPASLDPMRDHVHPVDPIDPGTDHFPEPVILPIEQVPCTRGVRDALVEVGVSDLVVVDVAGIGPFDLRLVFAVDPALGSAADGIEALRTGAALLPTLIRQEGERDALRLDALRDPLTGLLNRAGLDELVARVRPGSQLRAVLYLDLDGFKEVNDTHGHAAGDAVLLDTAMRLAAQVRPTDLVARLGGDEFVIVADSVLDEPSVVAFAQRIVGAVSHDVTLASGEVVGLAASAGIVVWPEGDSLASVIATADGLMYEAKRIGGGIAMQDATGRILVRDPLGGDAPPEQVERGRAPVLARHVDALGGPSETSAHVLLRGELCTLTASAAADEVLAALATLGFTAPPTALLIEPRGRGWVREGVLDALVAVLRERHPGTALTLLVDCLPSSIELRLIVEELRALGAVEVGLTGVGAASGGDLRMVAQTRPTLLSLDHEAVVNLPRTRPAGVVARLAAALAAAADIPLLVVDPPDGVDDAQLQSWGVRLVSRASTRTRVRVPESNGETS
jgi:diguanylate cyclase (GGDEF)-like protein